MKKKGKGKKLESLTRAKQLPIWPEKEVSYEGQSLDIMLHAWSGRLTHWLSPAALGIAMFDWLAHLTIAPGKQRDLVAKAFKKALQMGVFYFRAVQNHTACLPCEPTSSTDKRFSNVLWNNFPFNFYAYSFLSCQHWWQDSASSIRGVSKHHQHVVKFMVRQLLDIVSPTNFPTTNPEVLQVAFATMGRNFLGGLYNSIEDVSRIICDLPPVGTESFQVGVNLAITPGQVIYQNHLIELIQYQPKTKKVYAEPILIIPAWIMKYYILDLSPHNSLVKYLVGQGHTVFIISWKNPTSEDRNLGFDDYATLGIMQSLEAINHIVPQQKVHALGYCIGGTLLMMAAAAMANQSDDRLKSLTLLAAQVDFKDPGELSLFIDQSQISYLEDVMWEKGYLDGSQMASAFSMLHSNDLIWSRLIRDYLLGTRRPITDLIAWDLDTTRLPYRMHSQYLNELFLNNELSQGRFKLGRKKLALIDINAPIFVVSTVTDHIAPWKSVYKIHIFTDTEVTFLLTTGGHNAGIVSEPGHPGRSYQVATHHRGERHINSETWQEKTPHLLGSWWPEWEKWLVSHSGQKIPPPTMGASMKGYLPIRDAPGEYVFGK